MYFQQRNVYNSKIRKLSDLLSLLLDWQLPGLSRSNDAFVAQASQATTASEGSSDSMGGNNNNIINSNNNNGSNEMKTNDINDDGSTLASSFLAHYGSLITDMAPRYGSAGDFESMTFLFPVYMDEAKALIKNWIKRVNYNHRKFEHSYEEIESRVWDMMYNCSSGKKGTTRLDFRLKSVTQDRKNKIQESKDALAPIDHKDKFFQKNTKNGNNTNTNTNKTRTNADIIGGKISTTGNNNHNKKQDTLGDRRAFLMRGNSESVISHGEMEDLDNLVGDVMNMLDDDLDLSHSSNNGNGNGSSPHTPYTPDTANYQKNRRVLSDPLNNDSDDEKEFGKKINVNSAPNAHDRQATVDMILDSIDPEVDGSGARMSPGLNAPASDDEGYYSDFGGKKSGKGSSKRNRGGSNTMRETQHFFTTVSEILNNKENHIFPWTAFMLVWMMRRDNVSHIGGSSANENQIRAVLEFVYLFARGCFSALQEHWENTLLLTSLYHNAVDGSDPEDVKSKLCLQAVTVIGDTHIPFSNKKAVFDFLRLNLWLEYNQENVHKATTRNFFLKGIRVELKRIQDELNHFYDLHVYSNKIYPQVVPICDKKNVAPVIIRQDHDKVQGKCTWGPRKGNRYDRTQFEDICANRNIVPPKPSKNEGNFDEAYLLFCLELAKSLDPHFQKRVRNCIRNEITSAVHYPAPPKTFERAYHKITHDLQHLQSPRASRLIDYCRCVVGFQTLHDLRKGFMILDKAFRLCKIVNTFANKKQINVENYQYIDVYVLAQHPQNQFNKLICEVRLTLQKVRDLDFERRVIRDCFEGNRVLSSKEISSIMKEIARDARKKDKLDGMLCIRICIVYFLVFVCLFVCVLFILLYTTALGKRSSLSGSKSKSKSKSRSKR